MAVGTARRERPNVFSGLRLDRASDRRDDAVWLASAWPAARVMVVDFNGRAPFATSGRIHWLNAAALDPAIAARATFLGVEPVAGEDHKDCADSIDDGSASAAPPSPALGERDASPDAGSMSALAPDRALFALAAGHLPTDLLGQLDWQGLRETAALLPPDEAGVFAYAKALLLWQTRARYCGACGSETEPTRAGHGARCRRDGCGLEHFPRTDAAVIMLVEHDGHCLLGRQAGWPERRYSTLAGFVEPGESLEDALRREVLEEAGVQVGACHYQSSQPWPFPASLMLGYRAQALGRDISLGEELEDARWFSAGGLVEAVRSREVLLPFKVSISRRLIEDWLVDTLGRPLDELLPGAAD